MDGTLLRRHDIVAADSPIGRLGVTVCYDLRFPELYSRLRYEMGAQVMLVPSAGPGGSGEEGGGSVRVQTRSTGMFNETTRTAHSSTSMFNRTSAHTCTRPRQTGKHKRTQPSAKPTFFPGFP